MASRTQSAPVYEPQPAVHPNTLPPPPPRSTGHTPNLNRGHGTQLPSLSVVPYPQAGSHQSTPLSAISHQSPFVATLGTPIVSATGPTSRGTSPMAARQSGHFSVPYDPRDWASGDVRANQAARARQQQGEDGVASPPPPYSPQTAGQQPADHRSSTLVTTPEPVPTSLRSPQTTSSVSHSSTNLPAHHPSRGIINSHPNHRHSLHMTHGIPPPPPLASSSQMNSSVYDNSFNITGYPEASGSRDPSPGPSTYAPAARRAVSANADVSFRGTDSSTGRSNSKSRWHPGMPLPGPPPGPPPSGSRSQSLNNARDRPTGSGIQGARHARYTIHDSGLGPVPPTPADWNENEFLPNGSETTAGIHESLADRIKDKHASTSSISGPSLSRSSAVRDTSVKNLRERRAQNRNSRVLSASDMSGLVVDTSADDDAVGSAGPGSARTPALPRSASRVPSGLRQAFSPLASVLATADGITESPMSVSLPPLNLPSGAISRENGLRSAGLPPRALPTPPLSNKAPLSAHSVLESSQVSMLANDQEQPETFMRDSANRHAEFLRRERLAQTDAERLQIFADYIAHESAVRQRRYISAISSGQFKVELAREKLFPLPNPKSISTQPNTTVSTDIRPVSAASVNGQSRPDSNFWKDYQPALSPIASMEYDEMSSRGRTPSRWWESQTGSQSGDIAGRMKRSKRESKYMGLSKELLMAHSPIDEVASHQHSFPTADGVYPQEKSNPTTFGYYDEGIPSATPTFPQQTPETPRKLDISRFITLPPPYPRHYPAVNNNHPELAEYRTTVRMLADLSDVRTRRSRHELSVEALRSDLQRRLTEARRSFRTNIQAQIQEGSITFAEAAEAEEANKLNEFELEKKSIQAEFDTLQDVVINPLHDMLNDRVRQLDVSIRRLQEDLRSEARHQDPDRPQEEGDETPELLEKLTQLKWLFDTREQIHKECFEVLSERNNKYKAVVVFPYKWASNADKVRDTESFFETDTQTRYAAYCDESLKRHEGFQAVIDEHVSRGVELQSSAFWDIAPGLLDLLLKLPENPRHLPAVQIPATEYDENPSYHEHPHQYLYSLLSHAEKSTYQFIESQTNLHCLLHEVKTGLLAARFRALHAQEATTGAHCEDHLASKQEQESILTAELKQKASMIEQQWLEALGSQLQATRERVKLYLQQNNAWEEIAQDDA